MSLKFILTPKIKKVVFKFFFMFPLALGSETTVRKSFWQLFSSYMYVEKAAETMFVQKNCMFNVDEIDYWWAMGYSSLSQ